MVLKRDSVKKVILNWDQILDCASQSDTAWQYAHTHAALSQSLVMNLVEPREARGLETPLAISANLGRFATRELLRNSYLTKLKNLFTRLDSIPKWEHSNVINFSQAEHQAVSTSVQLQSSKLKLKLNLIQFQFSQADCEADSHFS